MYEQFELKNLKILLLSTFCDLTRFMAGSFYNIHEDEIRAKYNHFFSFNRVSTKTLLQSLLSKCTKTEIRIWSFAFLCRILAASPLFSPIHFFLPQSCCWNETLSYRTCSHREYILMICVFLNRRGLCRDLRH